MEATATRRSISVFGHSERKLFGLNRQALAFEPFTRRLFQQAGIGPGMRVLDLGCGAGDVSFLAGELVGASGAVLGIDRRADAIAWARARACAAGISHVSFEQGDPDHLAFFGKFDAIVGRVVLMYYRDPVDALRKLATKLGPGGVIVFQEFDTANCRSHPAAATFEHAVALIRKTLAGSGARDEMGLDLYPVFLAAGLPAPSMRMDALIGGGAHCPAYDLIADVVRVLLPKMEKLSIATAEEVDVATLAQRIGEEVAALNAVVLSPALIGAWSHRLN